MTFISVGEAIKHKSWRGSTRGVLLSLRMEGVLTKLLPKLLPSIADEVKTHSFREGKLNLLTTSPAISQEVYLHSQVILRELNEALGEVVVERIGFKTKAIPAATPA